MTTKEFKERLFDVINESDELIIRDVEFLNEDENIHVRVEDGSCFTVTCKESK